MSEDEEQKSRYESIADQYIIASMKYQEKRYVYESIADGFLEAAELLEERINHLRR